MPLLSVYTLGRPTATSQYSLLYLRCVTNVTSFTVGFGTLQSSSVSHVPLCCSWHATVGTGPASPSPSSSQKDLAWDETVNNL